MSSHSQDGDIRPEDSASQCSVSFTSTTASRRARIEAMAKKAALTVQVEALKEQQELELQELRLQQRRAELQLKAKISSAEAEERVYAQFKDQKSHISSNSPSTADPPLLADPPLHADQSCDETITYPIEDHEVHVPQDNKTTTDPIVEMLRQTQQQQKCLTETLQLPKAELMFYDGEPLKFWEFWRAFETNVDSATINDAAKLTRLLHYCKGDARKVIQACSVMESTRGYSRAKTLLKERFGNKHKVADMPG